MESMKRIAEINKKAVGEQVVIAGMLNPWVSDFKKLRKFFIERDEDNLAEVMYDNRIDFEVNVGALFCPKIAMRLFTYELEDRDRMRQANCDHVWGIGFKHAVKELAEALAPKTPEERYELIKFWNRSLDALDVIRNTKDLIEMKREVERLCPGIGYPEWRKKDYNDRFKILMFAAAKALDNNL